MAYYTKKNIKDFVEEKNDIILNNNQKPLTPKEEPISQLENENDIVGFFWIEFNDMGDGNLDIKMQGKTFVRIAADLYTDDRFAVDLYHAQIDGTTVAEVIQQRIEDNEKAKKTIAVEKKQEMQTKLAEQVKKSAKESK